MSLDQGTSGTEHSPRLSINRRLNLHGLAEPIAADATWGDISLPPSEVALLRRIADRIGRASPTRQTGRPIGARGIGVLFVGANTAEKLKAAQALANASRRALYRVDLSAVTSKYIGETQKNLARIFRAADRAGALLFLDEADALLGARSHVKDSHDRYARLELNYLLRSINAYGAVSVVATPATPSAAMLRRFRFGVYFR
jgi:SpoVK/Ycf46/Vps4 family AAA+-type ATPase